MIDGSVKRLTGRGIGPDEVSVRGRGVRESPEGCRVGEGVAGIDPDEETDALLEDELPQNEEFLLESCL